MPHRITQMAQRNTTIDALRFVAAYMVVTIHYGYPDLSRVSVFGLIALISLFALATVAVPLFFMITGYFYPTMEARHRVPAYLGRIVAVTVVALLLYVADELLCGALDGVPFEQVLQRLWQQTPPLSNIVAYSKMPIWAYHLWFLPALIISVIGVWVLQRLGFWRRPVWLLLAAVGAFASVAWHFPGAPDTRNWLFTGLPCMAAGTWAYASRRRIVAFMRTNVSASVLWTLVLIILMCHEAWFNIRFERSPYGHPLHLTSMALAAALLLWALAYPHRFKLLGYLGRRYSLPVYVLHLLAPVPQGWLATVPLVYATIIFITLTAALIAFDTLRNYLLRKPLMSIA